MKKLLYLAFAGLILTAIIWACEKNSVENKSQVDWSIHKTSKKLTQRENGTCLDTTCCVFSGNKYRQFKVPGYEPCTVEVTYDLYTCCSDTAHPRRLIFDNFIIKLVDDSCTALKNRWDSLHTATNYSLENSEIDAFYKAAMENAENLTIKGYFNNSFLHLRDSFPCSGTSFFGTEFYTAMCYVWCVRNYSGSPSYTTLDKLICGDICCLKQSQWCWNGSEVERHAYTYYTYGTTCGSQHSNCTGGTGDPRTVGTACDSHTCQ